MTALALAVFCTTCFSLIVRYTQRAGQSQLAVMGLNYVGLTLTGVCDAYAAVDRTLREVAAAERCPLLDAARGVPSNLEHFVDGVHTTRIGEAVLAKVVAEGLAEHVARRLANKAAGVGALN